VNVLLLKLFLFSYKIIEFGALLIGIEASNEVLLEFFLLTENIFRFVCKHMHLYGHRLTTLSDVRIFELDERFDENPKSDKQVDKELNVKSYKELTNINLFVTEL
jgi:hypothetical protein